MSKNSDIAYSKVGPELRHKYPIWLEFRYIRGPGLSQTHPQVSPRRPKATRAILRPSQAVQGSSHTVPSHPTFSQYTQSGSKKVTDRLRREKAILRWPKLVQNCSDDASKTSKPSQGRSARPEPLWSFPIRQKAI